MTDRRLATLRAALGFLRLPPREAELRLLHRWLDTWSGVGLITVGVERQGLRLSLGQIADGEWRCYFIGREHAAGASGLRCGGDAVASGAAGGVGGSAGESQPIMQAARRASLVVVLLLLALVGTASAEKPSFPPSVITNQDKIDWRTAEFDRVARAIDAEIAKPLPRQSETTYREALTSLADLLSGSQTLPGGLPALEQRAMEVTAKAAAGFARLANSKLKIGMTADQVRQIRGEPPRVSEVTTAAGIRQQWRYGTTVLSFDNGKLIEIQQTLKGE